MARRNYLLVVVLLISVGLLIGAILFSDGEGGAPGAVDDPSRTDPAASSTGKARAAVAPLAAAAAAAAPDTASPQREALDLPEGGSVVALHGRLLGDDGGARAGVELAWTARAPEARRASPGPGIDEDRVAAVTDERGAFRLVVPPSVAGTLSLARASNLLFAEGARRTMSIAASEADIELGDLVVQDGAVIAGRVLDEQGAGLPTARVHASPNGWLLWFRDEGQPVDEDGRFRIEGLEPGSYRLGASAAGFVPAQSTVELSTGARSDEIVITLVRGASIAGTVVDDRGRPVAAATVAPYRRQELGSSITVSTVDDAGGVQTDENGYFVLSGIDGPSASLRATAAGHASDSVPEVPVGTVNLRIELPRLGTIRGVLRDMEERPIAGSVVTATSADGSRTPSRSGPSLDFRPASTAETDAEGRFTLEGVHPGTVNLAARGDAHLPVDGPSVLLAAGSSLDRVTLRAEAGAVVEARVVDADGKPVAGATVVVATRAEEREAAAAGGFRIARREVVRGAFGRFGESPRELRRGKTDAEGRAVLAGLPAAEVELRAEHDELAPSKPVELTLARRSSVEAWLTLRPAGHVAVEVVDAAGEPVADARFVLRGPAAAEQDDAVVENGTTDAAGRADVGPLLPGRYTAVLHKPNRAARVGNIIVAGFGENDRDHELAESAQEVEVRAGQTVDVRLLWPTFSIVRGIVRGVGGPASGIELRLTSSSTSGFQIDLGLGSNGGWSAKTGADGAYEFRDVPAGSYELQWGWPDQVITQRSDLDVPPGGAEILRDLDLLGGTVRITVLSGKGGEPLADAEVELRPADTGGQHKTRMFSAMTIERSGAGQSRARSILVGGAAKVHSDADGVAVIEHVPPGTYVAVVSHAAHSEGRRADLVVIDRELTDAGSLTLDAAGTIRGRIVEPAGEGEISLVECRAVDDPDAGGKTTVAQAGAFVIDQLAPGEYELRVFHPGPEGAASKGPPVRTVVRAGEVSQVELRSQ